MYEYMPKKMLGLRFGCVVKPIYGVAFSGLKFFEKIVDKVAHSMIR